MQRKIETIIVPGCLAVLLAVACFVAAGGAFAHPSHSPSPTPDPSPTPSPTPVIVFAPTSCVGPFVHTVTAGDRQIVNGTPVADKITVGSQNLVNGQGGNDCLVLDGSLNDAATGSLSHSTVIDVGGGALMIAQGFGDTLVGGNGSDLKGNGSTQCLVNDSDAWSGCSSVVHE